jgi:hypothetical protein
VGNADGTHRRDVSGDKCSGKKLPKSGKSGSVEHAQQQRLEGQRYDNPEQYRQDEGLFVGTANGDNSDTRQVITPLGDDVDGLPAAMGGAWPEVHNRVAQLKGAGNAIVPECAAIFLNAIRRQLA